MAHRSAQRLNVTTKLVSDPVQQNAIPVTKTIPRDAYRRKERRQTQISAAPEMTYSCARTAPAGYRRLWMLT